MVAPFLSSPAPVSMCVSLLSPLSPKLTEYIIPCHMSGSPIPIPPQLIHSPDFFLTSMHATPVQAFQIHVELRTHHSLAMHFATFAGTLIRTFLVSEKEEWGSKKKQSNHGTRHDCAHREEEGTMLPFRALEHLNTRRIFVSYDVIRLELSYDARKRERWKRTKTGMK